MSRTAGTFIDAPIAGNIEANAYPDMPGEWQIREVVTGGDRRIVFGCPLRPGTTCGVLLKPHSKELLGVTAWVWDGNTTAPTLFPSINCINDPPRSCGCGWHGLFRAGATVRP